MVTKDLFDKIRARIADTPEEVQKVVLARMEALNERLRKQLDSQRMTEEILNKRCTL